MTANRPSLQIGQQRGSSRVVVLGSESMGIGAAEAPSRTRQWSSFCLRTRNYLVLHTGAKSHTIRGTLDTFSKKLNPSEFVRVNRSAIIRLDSIRELQPWFHGEYKVVLKDGATIPWTRRYITADASRRILS